MSQLATKIQDLCGGSRGFETSRNGLSKDLTTRSFAWRRYFEYRTRTPAPLNKDVRERIIDRYLSGVTRTSALAKQFAVSKDTIRCGFGFPPLLLAESVSLSEAVKCYA